MAKLVPLRTNRFGRNDKGLLTILTPEDTEFEFTAEWMARFQNSNGAWVEEKMWPKVKAISICRTKACDMRGKQVQIILTENVDGIFRAMCGFCRNAPDLYELP